jgi:hypothetical protein
MLVPADSTPLSLDFVAAAIDVLHVAVPLCNGRHGCQAVVISRVCLEAADRLASSTTSAYATTPSAAPSLYPMGPYQEILASIWISKQIEAGRSDDNYDRLEKCTSILRDLRKWYHQQSFESATGDLMEMTPFREYITKMVNVYMEVWVGKRDEAFVHPIMHPAGCQNDSHSHRNMSTRTARKNVAPPREPQPKPYEPRGECRYCARLDAYLMSPSWSAVPLSGRPQARMSWQQPQQQQPLVFKERGSIVDHITHALFFTERTTRYSTETSTDDPKSKVRLVIKKEKRVYEMEKWDGPKGRVERAWIFLRVLFAAVDEMDDVRKKYESIWEENLVEREDLVEGEANEWQRLAKRVLGEEEWQRIRAILDDTPPMPSLSSRGALDRKSKAKAREQLEAGPSTGARVGTKRKRG